MSTKREIGSGTKGSQGFRISTGDLVELMCTLSVHVPPMVGFSLLLLHGFSEGLDRRQKHYLRGNHTTFASLHP